MKGWRRSVRLALVGMGLLALTTAGCDEQEKSAGASVPADQEKQVAEAAEATAAQPEGEWCKGHAIPESMCTKCHPELVEEFKAKGDWCAEHGFPESGCPVCNPMDPPGSKKEPAQPGGEWCKGHAIPESMCTKCHPELVDEFKAKGDWCAEHGFPESGCPVCNPMQPPGAGGAERIVPDTKVRFASAEVEEHVGIEVARAESADVAATVASTARIEYDRNGLADVRALVPGIVREVRADLGEQVAAGDALFVLESAHVGELQGRLEAARERARAARSNLRRQRELREASIASARSLELARRDLGTARAEVQGLEASLGLTGAGEGAGTGRFAVTAPLDGTLVRRPAVLGVLATAETSLATVADTSRMWALLDVREDDASAVRVGQTVAVTVDGVPDVTFRGELTWVGSEVDRRTRTVEARAEISNAEGLLRAHQFARATIEVGAPDDAVTIPKGAVQRFDGTSVVFVRLEAGLYEPREVRTGRRTQDQIQVLDGVRPGEEVVTTGAYLLKTELDPGSIGAGCCEVD